MVVIAAMAEARGVEAVLRAGAGLARVARARAVAAK